MTKWAPGRVYCTHQDKWNSDNTGIKHGLLCSSICWTLRVVLNNILVYQKTMFDHFYLIQSLPIENIGKMLWKVQNFCIAYNGVQKHEVFSGFENACSRALTFIILTSLNLFTCMHGTVNDINFCDGSRMHIHKVNKTKLCSGPASPVHIGVWTVDMQSSNIQEWNQITPNYTM